MKPSGFAPRLLAVALSACLILPPHAYALRPQQQEAEPQRVGLEEVLRSGDPDALIRGASSRLAQWMLAPASAPAVLPRPTPSESPPVLSGAGLEEAVQAGVRRIQDRWVYFVLAVPDTLGESTSAAVLGWLDRIAALGARAGRQSSVVLITRPSNHGLVQAAISKAKMKWPWVRLVGVEAVSSPVAGQDMQVALGAVRKELDDVHAERHEDGTVVVDKTGNFRSDERDLMLLSAGQSPPSEDLLLAALGAMKGSQLAEVWGGNRLIATLVRGDLADGLSAGIAGLAPEKIQLKGGPKGVSTTGSPTGLAGYELFTLPPPDGVVRSFGNYEEFVRFSADEIRSRYESFLKNATGKKHFWVLVTGTGGSGKTTFIRGTEEKKPEVATDLLRELGKLNIPVLSINEDWWAATAKVRDDLRDSGHPADGADYADSRRTWIRWPALRAAFRALADTVGSITLKELHNSKPGKPIDREQTLDLSEKSVIVVEGHFLDDPWLIPGDWFDMQILLGRTYKSIFAVRRNRARWPDRTPARTQWNEDVVFRPTWWNHIRRNHPEWTANLVFDLDDFDHPKQLSYLPPSTSWADDHRKEIVSLQSFARGVAGRAANRLVRLHASVVSLDNKPDKTAVTKADYAVQEMVMRAVLTKYPDHYVDAEEDLARFKPNDLKLKELLRRNEQNRGKADFVWVVDPLDGTREYQEGGKAYVFAIGILYLGQPLYAAILSPESGLRYEADPVRGIVTLNGEELPPLQLRAGRPVVVAHGSESRGIPHPDQDKIEQFAALAGKPSSIALTTSGIAGKGGEGHDLDAVSSVVTKTNDAIPSSILLTTLGGKAVHPDGRPIFPVTRRDLSAPDREMRVIAGVPEVVDRLVQITRQAGMEELSEQLQNKVKSLYQIVKGSLEEESIGISYSYLKLGEVQEVKRYSELLTRRIREDLGSLLSQEPNKWVIVSPGGFGIPNAASLISAKVAQLLNLPHVTLETGVKADPALVQRYASFARREDRSLVVHGVDMGEADVDLLRGKNAIVIDDAIITGNILKRVFTLLTQTGLVRIEPYVLVKIDGLGDNAFEDRVNRKAFKRDGLQALVQVLNDDRSIYTTRLVHYVSELAPEQFRRLLAQLTSSAKLNLYLYSIEYFSAKSPSNVDMLRESLRKETQPEFPSVQTLRAIQSEKFFKAVGSMLKSYHFKVPLQEAGAISRHLKNLLKDHPVQQGSGLEEAIWPDTSALALRSIEPILILQAEGGFGDVAYLRKLLDAFNARGLTPVVGAVGTPEKQAEAMEKFERFTTGTPVSYTLWREQAGQMVQADGRPVERGRTLRPVLIQHFSQVNPNWSRDLAERLVPELFQPLYEPPGRFFLIGFNAPGNAFGGYLKPGQGEFLNLYQTPPTPPGVHEPNPIYTGNLFDPELKSMIEEIRPLSREARRVAALEALKLPGELAEAAKSKGGWASLYISQGGSPTQLNALTQAFSNSYGTAAFFTFFVENPRLWYYPDDYWRPHEEIVDSLKKNPKVSFVDVSGIFGSRARPDAPVLVVNLGRVTREGVRLLAGASDLMLAPGHNTFVNAMGMAASQVGPKVVLSMPVFRTEREELQQALRSMGARRTLEEIVAFDRLREPVLTPEVFKDAVKRLTRLLKSRKRQQRFQRDIAQLATRAMGLSGDPTDGNLGNRLLDLLARVDRGAALSELISTPRQTPEAVEEVRDYQRQAAETFRQTGQEPLPPATAGLEESVIEWDPNVVGNVRKIVQEALTASGIGQRISVKAGLHPAIQWPQGPDEPVQIWLSSFAPQDQAVVQAQLHELLRGIWVTKEVQPALKRLIESNFSDFSLLRSVGKTSGGEDQEWLEMIHQLEKELVSQRIFPGKELETFMHVVRWLNKNWLVKRKLLLFSSGNVGQRRALDFLNSLVMGRIEMKTTYELAGRPIPVYFVRSLFLPPVSGAQAMWHPEGMIVVRLEKMEEVAQSPWFVQRWADRPDEELVRAGFVPVIHRARMELYERIRQRYQDPVSYFPVVLAEHLFEELRHGLDHIRVESAAGRPFPVWDGEIFNGFVDTHLRQGGLLRQIWDDLGALPLTQSEKDQVRFVIGHAFLELSGHLTSVGVGRDPAITLLSWLNSLKEGFSRSLVGYAFQGAFGIRLLARELGIAEDPISLENWAPFDHEELASLSLELAKLPPERLRLAAKAVFKREFTHPLDEPPLPKINPDGSLVPRVDSSLAGLEEPKTFIELGTPGEFAYQRVFSLTPEGIRAIERLEENMPREARMPADVLKRHLRHPEAIVLIARSESTKEIAGYIFGLPQKEVEETVPRDKQGRRLYEPVDETFYEMSWQVLPEYQGQGVGTALRRFFRDEVREKRYPYLAFHQKDRSEAQLIEELSARYGQGDELFHILRGFPPLPGTSISQQFVVLKLNRLETQEASTTGLEQVEELRPLRLEEAMDHEEDEVGEKARWLNWAMQRGLPVPQSLIVPAAYLAQYEPTLAQGKWPPGEMLDRLKSNQRVAGSGPHLIVRSSADRPYLGLLDSVWIGMNEKEAEGKEELYARFLRQWGQTVLQIEGREFDLAAKSIPKREPTRLAKTYLELIHRKGYTVPSDLYEQMAQALAAVRRSARRMVTGTFQETPNVAAIIQPFFPTLGEKEGIGFFTTHDTETGTARLNGEVIVGGLGEELMKGTGNPGLSFAGFERRFPNAWLKLQEIYGTLLKEGIPVSVEFAFDDYESGNKIIVLQVSPLPGDDLFRAEVLSRMTQKEGKAPLTRSAPFLREALAPLRKVQYEWQAGSRPSPLFSGGRTIQGGIVHGVLQRPGAPFEKTVPAILMAGEKTSVDQVLRSVASGSVSGLMFARPLAVHERQQIRAQGIPTIKVSRKKFKETSVFQGRHVILDAQAGQIGSLYPYEPEKLRETAVAESFAIDAEELKREAKKRYSSLSYRDLTLLHKKLFSEAAHMEDDLSRQPNWLQSALSLAEGHKDRVVGLLKKSLETHYVHQLMSKRSSSLPSLVEDREIVVRLSLPSDYVVVPFYRSGLQMALPADEIVRVRSMSKIEEFLQFLELHGVSQERVLKRLRMINTSYNTYDLGDEKYRHIWDRQQTEYEVIVGLGVPGNSAEEVMHWLEAFYTGRDKASSGLEEVEKARVESSSTGLEERPAPMPLRTAADFADLGGTSAPFLRLAGEAFLEQEGVLEAIEVSGGVLSLGAEATSRLYGAPAMGAFIVREGGSPAQVGRSAAPQPGRIILADKDIPVRENWPWVKVGDWPELRQALLSADPGDYLFVEEEPGVTRGVVEAALREAFPQGRMPLALLGSAEAYGALPEAALDLLDREGQPPVVVLRVEMELKSRSGETFHLILMA